MGQACEMGRNYLASAFQIPAAPSRPPCALLSRHGDAVPRQRNEQRG
jgi:hypothetical protein